MSGGQIAGAAALDALTNFAVVSLLVTGAFAGPTAQNSTPLPRRRRTAIEPFGALARPRSPAPLPLSDSLPFFSVTCETGPTRRFASRYL